MALNFNHIAVSVSDVERSLLFYQRHFGFQSQGRYSIDSGAGMICIAKKDQLTLEFFSFKDGQPLPEYRQNLETDLKTVGVKHFAFTVEAIEEIYAKLLGNGVEVVTDMRTSEDGARYFFIKDPDGILVEIMEEKK